MTFEVTSAVYVEAVASAQVVDVALPFSYPLAVVSVSYLDAVVSYAQYLDAVVVMGHLVYAAEPEPTDTTAPTLAISSGAASIHQGATTSLNFAFSEDVGATFTQADVVVSAGVGSSMYFDGSGDYALASDSADFDLGSVFTLECWVNFTVLPTPGNQATFIMRWDGGLVKRAYYFLLDNTSGTPKLSFGVSPDGTSPSAKAVTSNWTPLLNTWHHVAAISTGSTIGVCADGVLAASATSTVSTFNTDIGVSIGAWSGAAGGFINGHLGNLRITKGVARYTANFTPPQEQLSLTGDPHAANVSLLINGEGANNSTTFVDSSPVPKTITAVGNAKISTAQFPFRSGVLSNFAGSGSSYSATFKGTKVGTASISVASGAYADAAGNLGAAASLTLDVLEVYPFFSIGSTQPYSALSSLMSMGSDPATMEYKTVPFTIRFGENS